MKTVLCFISKLSGGGAERQMCYLINFLAERGYKLKVLTYDRTEGSDVRYIPLKGVVEEVHIHESFKPFLLFKLVLQIRRMKFDCLISYLEPNSNIAYLATWPKKKFKFIASIRNAYEITNKIKKGMHYMSRVDYVVPNSITMASFLKQAYPDKSNIIIPILNFTDLDTLKPVEHIIREKIVVCVFSRYVPQKNTTFLAEVLRRMRLDGYSQYEFHWYGSNKINNVFTSSYLELKKMVHKYDLEENFYLHGFVNNTLDIMSDCDVVALPSFMEGLSNTIGEAICCGLPVICSDVSDNKVMVKDGQNGFLFDPHNVSSAVKAFEQFADLNEDQRASMCKRSRLIAEELFCKEKFVNEYCKIIDD